MKWLYHGVIQFRDVVSVFKDLISPRVDGMEMRGVVWASLWKQGWAHLILSLVTSLLTYGRSFRSAVLLFWAHLQLRKGNDCSVNAKEAETLSEERSHFELHNKTQEWLTWNKRSEAIGLHQLYTCYGGHHNLHNSSFTCTWLSGLSSLLSYKNISNPWVCSSWLVSQLTFPI